MQLAGKCAVLGMMVGCGASALESVLVAGGRVRPKGGASPMVGAHFFSSDPISSRSSPYITSFSIH